MSEFITVARPYAKAAFDFDVEHQSVERWQDMLAFAAEVTKNEQMAELLSGALAPENGVEYLDRFPVQFLQYRISAVLV